jgi:nitrite reductase/ring-hydroxylating ferredoxin subunit
VVFFVRYDGVAYGYLNRCAHVPMELDWNEGQFFESSGLYLMCATHGAIYAPDTGKCVGGPCRGGRLRPVHVDERDTPEGRTVFWLPDADLRPASA